MAKKKSVEKAPREMTRRALSRHQKQQRRQRFIFFGGIAIIVAVVLIIIGGWFAGEYLPLRETVIQVYDTNFDTAYFIDTMVIIGKSQGSGDLVGISDTVINQIITDELLKQEAAKLGISISDEEVERFWANSGFDINDAARDLVNGQLLPGKLKSGHFDALVPNTDSQVNLRAMMVESDAVALLVREKILSGENFTVLVEQYAVDALSKSNNGSYGFHSESIFKNTLNSIPLDYAFSANVGPGDVSIPLSDNASSKSVGYWLIRLNERPTEDSANVSAVYLNGEEEALSIRERLEAGEELGPIADQYSQYVTSQQNHGEMGIVSTSDNVSNAFNGYVFNAETEVGKWSQPIRDDFYTTGGYWVVQVIDKAENMELTTGDRTTLIDKLYSVWSSEIFSAASPFMSNYITEEIKLWVIERASRQL